MARYQLYLVEGEGKTLKRIDEADFKDTRDAIKVAKTSAGAEEMVGQTVAVARITALFTLKKETKVSMVVEKSGEGVVAVRRRTKKHEPSRTPA